MSIEQSDGKRQLKFKGLSINSGGLVEKSVSIPQNGSKAFPKYPAFSEAAVKQGPERFDEVLVLCTHELNRIASEVSDAIGKTEAEIFLAQKHIMNDPKLIAAIEKEVAEDRKNVEWAISDVLGEYEEKFATLDNQYLRERSSDIGEIRRRLLSRISNKKSGFICEGQAKCAKGENRIIVAEELTPDMVINMNLEKVGLSEHMNNLMPQYCHDPWIPSVSGTG